MAFSDSTNGRIAGHLRDQVHVEREKRGLQSHAGSRHGSFAPSMACADHYNIVLFCELHPFLFYRPQAILPPMRIGLSWPIRKALRWDSLAV
jgi:hypothetical protein